MVALTVEHTTCYICRDDFEYDVRSDNEDIKKHLPVLSKSCDHWFCHGCIIEEHFRLSGESGSVSKWIKCMVCRQNAAFCPSKPIYHRMLIDLLDRCIPVKEE